MNKYHITFRLTPRDFMSRGQNFDAEDPAKAYIQWREKYPSSKFISLIDIEELADIKRM